MPFSVIKFNIYNIVELKIAKMQMFRMHQFMYQELFLQYSSKHNREKVIQSRRQFSIL